jgi:hypothetical protein
MAAFFGRPLVLGAWVLGAFLFVPSWAAAQAPTSDELARRHFDSGAAYLQESDYENALKAFEKAYELSKRPAILINIATVQERRGNLESAIQALRTYLELEPAGEHAETTKLRLQNLEKRQAEAPPPAPPPVAPAPAPAPAPLAPPPEPATTQTPAAPPKDDGGSVDRTPAFIAFGIAGAAAIGAGVTGILANGQYQDAKEKCSPNCKDSELSSGRTLAVVSTVATGVAVVGAGFGLVLWLSPPSDAAASSASVRVGFAGGAPRAEASFAF